MPANGTARFSPRRSPAPAAAERTARRAARRWRARRREPGRRRSIARGSPSGSCRCLSEATSTSRPSRITGQAASCGAVGPPGTAARTTTRPPDGTRPGRGVPRPACRRAREQVGWPMVVTSVTLYFTTSCLTRAGRCQGRCRPGLHQGPGRSRNWVGGLSDADDRGARDGNAGSEKTRRRRSRRRRRRRRPASSPCRSASPGCRRPAG